ncbi:sensor histidine kinase [Nocardioides stalactiti]|uniref:sensor histidine kinase n=1 Tax=Nocardioides stalactiti TaxID=2755356 RepID=UPI001602D52F|nr:histidine kinase [Nocardioides stalactiti]
MGMSRRSATALAGGVLAAEVTAVVVMLLLDLRLERDGYGEHVDSLLDPWVWLFVLAAFGPAAVGLVIARSHPRHPVGWLFLGLSVSVLAAGVVEEWFIHAAIVDPPEIGGAEAAAVVADKIFLPWWTLLTLILLLTPTGTYLSDRWRRVGAVTIVASAVFLALSVISDQPLSSPYDRVGNPWAIPSIAPYPTIGSRLAFGVVAVGLLLGGASLVVRWRRATGDERQRLLWLVLAVVPLPAVIPVHLYAVTTDNGAFIVGTLALFLVLIPAVAGMSVLRYRLYDVERVVATTLTYSLVSAVLVAIYACVVWLGAHVGAAWSPSPVATATTGAVAAALAAGPLRRGLQDAIDRRFNRRGYEAAQVVRGAVAEARAGLDPEALLQRALGDPTLTVAYPGPGGWVGGAGEPTVTPAEHVEVTRSERVVARIGYDPRACDRATVAQVGRIAAAELDNTRLRAELGRRLVEIAASRRRLSQAQREERRRIERDLHDGAQQSLLALAFELQAAQLGGDPGTMRDALVHGAEEARRAAQELRDLANGLHPAALVDGGLAGVVDDLARRSPVPIEVDVDAARFDPAAEFTAWLVVAEAVTNAHKHANASRIQVLGTRGGDGVLRLRVSDDGLGGADPTGSGLRGLHDRVESAGGTLQVRSDDDGTTVEVTLPCGS